MTSDRRVIYSFESSCIVRVESGIKQSSDRLKVLLVDAIAINARLSIFVSDLV